MNRDLVYRTALANGFNLKEQPDGTMDLNPCVYELLQNDLEETLRSVLKEAGVSNVDDAAPGDLPGMVNYKIQHMEKYLNAARKENHRLKNSDSPRTIQAVRDFVADDAAAVSYQTMGQYRTAVLNMIKEAA